MTLTSAAVSSAFVLMIANFAYEAFTSNRRWEYAVTITLNQWSAILLTVLAFNWGR